MGSAVVWVHTAGAARPATGNWQCGHPDSGSGVFLALVVGVSALICLTIVWMVFKAIRHGDWSAENFARIKSLLMGRRGVDEYRDSERD